MGSIATTTTATSQATTLSLDPAILGTIVQAYAKDPAFSSLYHCIKNSLPLPPEYKPEYIVNDQGLLFLSRDGKLRLCIPNDTKLRGDLLAELHDIPLSGHLGFTKTYQKAYDLFYWPRMDTFIRNYIARCPTCQRTKPSTLLPQGLLQPLAIPSDRWQDLSMDFIVDLPRTKRGHTAILVIVDRMTKRVILIATTTTVTAVETAQLFFDHVFRYHGLPRTIVSDRDPRFTSKFWSTLFKLVGTRLALSSARHPQTDGQTERVNRTLEQMLRAYVNFDMDNWDTLLTPAEFAINNMVHASTGMSAFQLDTGRDPLLPIDLLAPSTLPSVSDFTGKLATTLRIAQDHLREAQRTQAVQANKHRRDVKFNAGDQVLVKSTALTPPYELARPKAKFRPVYVLRF